MERKKLYIQTFGCQMNVQDSEKAVTLLRRAGYESTDEPRDADLIIVNTCSIREKAAQKICSQLGRFRELKAQNPRLRIGVGGCLAQHWGERFFKKAPYLDFVFGTHQIHRVPEMVATLANTGERQVQTDFCDRVSSLDMAARPDADAVGTFVTIMQGCNNSCAYCVVPALRGREQSRPLNDIITEVRMLAETGIREVTLLGQNVNSYGGGEDGSPDFTELIQAIGAVAGIERIRFTTSHPKDLSQRLIASFGAVAPLCEHIHLPVQSGSDRILARMNRGYTAGEYRRKIDALRAACPGISITSDVIVGFPGEGDDDFQATLALMENIRFDNLFSFQYSPREGTPAAGMDGQVPEAVKRRRLQILQALQADHTLQKNEGCVGRTEAVLVEGVSRNEAAEITGRTRGNRIVNFPGDRSMIGRTASVKITKAFLHSLRGRMEGQGGEHVH